MSQEDMAYGVSQLASLDEKSEGTIVPADSEIYWDNATKIKKANAEELSKVKVVGRGGTVFGNFTSDYEEHIGKCDFLIIITDGYLIDSDVASMKNPGIDVIWLITSSCDFNPPFGRKFILRD
jgi:predicted metal-dependent peptidase